MAEKSLPRLLLDMNLSPLTVNALQDLGWVAIRIPEVLPINSPDSEILLYAREHQMTVVTHDVDFTALLALGRYDKPSVIHLRLDNAKPHFVTERIIDAVTEMAEGLEQGVIVSVDETTLRYRNLPII